MEIVMADYNDPRTTATGFGSVPRAGGQVVFDAGLRKHMLSIYNYMTSGVLLTGIVALLTFNSGLAYSFASGPLMWLVALSPLVM
jgi:FtsH-binding integral membrane protein